MLSFKEQADDIADVIAEVTKAMNVPITDNERISISRRLAKYHSKELFSVLMSLHDKQFFPSGAELEQQVRRALGKEPAKGLSEEQIEKNRKELIASGQDPKKANGGATMAKSTLRLREVVPAVVGSVNLNASQIANQKAPLPEVFVVFDELANLTKQFIAATDPLADLEDFDEDPLAGLEDF